MDFFFGTIFNVHAETIVIDRIYLIVNSQMLTRSEAQEVKSAMMSQKSPEEKTQTDLNKQLMMQLMQEMLLLDRANALKILPMENEWPNEVWIQDKCDHHANVCRESNRAQGVLQVQVGIRRGVCPNDRQQTSPSTRGR